MKTEKPGSQTADANEIRVNGILQGWTGKKCPRCGGDGMAYDATADNDRPCPKCGGTGDEYGDVNG